MDSSESRGLQEYPGTAVLRILSNRARAHITFLSWTNPIRNLFPPGSISLQKRTVGRTNLTISGQSDPTHADLNRRVLVRELITTIDFSVTCSQKGKVM